MYVSECISVILVLKELCIRCWSILKSISCNVYIINVYGKFVIYAVSLNQLVVMYMLVMYMVSLIYMYVCDIEIWKREYLLINSREANYEYNSEIYVIYT